MFKKIPGSIEKIPGNIQKVSGEYSKSLKGTFETLKLSYLETLSKSLALYASSYDSLIIVGDFNISVEEFCMSGFNCSTSSSNLYL